MTPEVDLGQKKFFSVLISEISGEQDNKISRLPVKSKFGPRITMKDYLPTLYEELTKRRNYAIMCLTPDKLARASAKDLVYLIDRFGPMLAQMERLLPVIEDKKEELPLSEDEKRRIEQFLGGDIKK